MVKGILGRAVLFGLIPVVMTCLFVGLMSSCNTNKKIHVGSYRLMCWLPNGEIFYNGTASELDAQGWGLTFVPDIGPQAGMTIYTTNACTWAKL
jgi:hypothetical protein